MKFNIVSKLNDIGDAITNTLSENSPKIFIAIGAVGTVAAGVMACKATLKAPSVLENHKALLNDIHVAHATLDSDTYSESDYRLDLVKAYARVSWDMIKLYGPAVILEVASIGSIFTSNHIMQRRNASLAAAYATIDAAYTKYRKNVAERFGEDVEKEVRLGLTKRKAEVIEQLEDGDNKMTKEEIYSCNTSDIMDNPYARFFGPGYSNEATKSSEYNNWFLIERQNYWNDILKSRYEWKPNGKSKLGYVYLEEILLDLGLLDPEEEMPHFVGWIYDPENQEKYGDGYISFGMIDGYTSNERFVNRSEATAILDFNVDGIISDKVYRKKASLKKVSA